ncbi:MAG: Hsp70 family protein [Planctomycetaceae bacterium]|jgi:molecular chaperone DnaK|nr:Hsp70 family protein [Planctomycetaceae bacterium]
METILGIDLGTTNSEVSIIRDKEIIVVEKDGRKLLPSVVGIDLSGNLLVGHAARNQAILYPDRTVKSIKRLMGDNIKVKLGDNEYSPPEISAMILKTLKTNAEEQLSQQFTKAVITVPAFFNDNQREATRLAGELAGLEVVRIINEPTAASLCYETETGGSDKSNLPESAGSIDKSETIMVYDLGGGTFDVSIVRAESGVIEVRASHGDTHLGGDDFDQLLFDHVCDKFLKSTKVDIRDIPTAVSRVMQAVEAAKIELSSNPFAVIKEEFIAEQDGVPLHLDMEIGRYEYEQMIFPLLDKTIVCLNEALEDAGLRPSEIDKIIMVGGASRTPIIHSLLENRMGMIPHGEIDPDLCVTMGAAIQGGLISGVDIGRVLVDITPHTLGVHVISISHNNFYIFSPLIKRNTSIPCKRSEIFLTSYEDQSEVDISIYQGEHNDVRQNMFIGNFMLEGLSKGVDQEILCQFELDINGILHVTAIEKSTGLKSDITIENIFKQQDLKANDNFKNQLKQFFHEKDHEDDDDGVHEGVHEGDNIVDSNISGLSASTGSLSDASDRVVSERSDKVEVSLKSGIDNDLILEVDKLLGDSSTVYSEELNIIRKGLKMLGGNLKTGTEDLERLIRELVKAVKQHDKKTVQELSTELDDMLYYLDDSL